MGLAGPFVADGNNIFTRPMYCHPASCMTSCCSRCLVQQWDDREARRPCPALHDPLAAVKEFQFGRPYQAVGMVDTTGGALNGQFAVFPFQPVVFAGWCARRKSRTWFIVSAFTSADSFQGYAVTWAFGANSTKSIAAS